MTAALKSKCVCVVDRGLFVEMAVRLVRDFGRVLYFSEWKKAFPHKSEHSVGDGIAGVERIENLWDHVDEVDLFVFTDVGDGDMQKHLRSLGKRVWGSAGGEWLELDRWRTREVQGRLGVGAPMSTRVVGLEKLERMLKKTKDVWVKVSIFRGTFETFNHRGWFTTEPWFLDVAKRLGPLADTQEFIVEEHVDGVELAYDGFTVDGQWPVRSLFGYEIKDKAYVGGVRDYQNLPVQIREVNTAFEPILRGEQVRSFLAFEMRVDKDGEPVVIDPCMRCGSPPTEVNMELWSNLGEIFWHGSVGEMVEPIPEAKYGAMALINSTWALENWTAIRCPNELRRWVKIRYLCEDSGHLYFVPKHDEMPEIGAVVGLGNTMEEAIAAVRATAEHVESYRATIHERDLDGAVEAIREGEAFGIDFD